jgi:aminopeptidase YwaD
VQSPERLERQTRVLGYPWPALSRLPGGSLPLQPRRADTAGLPAYAIGRAAVEALFGSLDAFREWLRAQDTAPTPALLPEVRVDLSVALVERERVRVPNVVGWLPGQRAREEYILLGAHYDHVGTYSSPGEQDSIYNGADDNASGTAGMLLIARALALGRVKPLRSILFVAFSGEEKGLLGSQAFVEAPPLPLSGCRAMLNLDMIGRNHPDSLLLGWRGEHLAQLLQEENRRLRRPFLLGELGQSELFLASDHASFARRGIPVVFFFTGLHEDYHRPSDHAERLDYDKLTRVALLAARLLWHLAQVSAL